ncbi:OTU domain-containing protein 5-B isoform X1 [Nylanderia fulva]|uniref:OTU domain-containing protein 5-B isoform X1 n=1 Tax=Nylanderia fulva TaxID=613905 RepID=UPI0010FB4184|nr:OTU domain-containing protein 5-B isoform X1 [Nylanderia fulva]XP_029156711.1 OTU domain-containing protein 5-B isoform X1 [Nylanderia fulva]XP_029156712.1 OTU domain-containing protein 5-B isoform X1 [Nylanderia fulva]
MTILSKKKTNASKDRTRETGAGPEVDVHHGVVQNEHNSGNIALPNSPYQVRGASGFDLHGVPADHGSHNGPIVLTGNSYEANVDRREDKHFEDGSGPSHGKRHRQRASPHSCISRPSRAKRDRERDRGRERERERERERQATPPAASCNSQGTDSSVSGRVNIVGNASNLEEANGYNSGDEYTGRTENNLTLVEWQERDRWFEKRLKKKSLIIKKMAEDGACLFRAVADQVYGDQEMHGIVRKHCMDYISSNQEFFSHFVAEDFSTYVDRKRQEYVHGNHIEMQAMSEMYNRSIQLYCYSTEPINIFHTMVESDNEPIRLSYQRGSHYNSIVDPFKATIGVGLGLPSYNPGAADRALISDAVRQSEELQIEQTMLEDKIKATDWEATNEAIEEQVARESYLQWLRDNEMRKARSASSSSTSTVTSAQHNHSHFHSHGGRGQQRSHTSSPTTTQTSQDNLRNSPKVSDAVRYSKRSPQHQSTQGSSISHLPPEFEVKVTSQEPVPGSSKEANASPDISLFNRLPPEVFGLTDWEDSHILSQVLATSQQEYLDSLKQSRVSAGSDGANTIESSAINNS